MARRLCVVASGGKARGREGQSESEADGFALAEIDVGLMAFRAYDYRSALFT